MRLVHSLLAATALVGFTLTAHADTVTYTVSATLSASNGGTANGTLSGAITFDNTAGTVVTSNISDLVQGSPSILFNSVSFSYGYLNYQYGYAGLKSADGTSAYLYYALPPDAASGVLTLCQSGQVCGGVYPFSINAYFGGEKVLGGTLTPVSAAAATPDPSSLILLGTGVLGLAGATRRRFLTR